MFTQWKVSGPLVRARTLDHTRSISTSGAYQTTASYTRRLSTAAAAHAATQYTAHVQRSFEHKFVTIHNHARTQTRTHTHAHSYLRLMLLSGRLHVQAHSKVLLCVRACSGSSISSTAHSRSSASRVATHCMRCSVYVAVCIGSAMCKRALLYLRVLHLAHPGVMSYEFHTRQQSKLHTHVRSHGTVPHAHTHVDSADSDCVYVRACVHISAPT